MGYAVWHRLLMRAVIFALLVNAYCFLTAPAGAADIRFGSTGCTLHIEGPIEEGDDAVFYDRILEGWDEGDACTSFGLELASPGGNLGAAIKIGRQVRALHISTSAPLVRRGPPARCLPTLTLRDEKNCLCASACFFIWTAGSERSGERIFVHRPRLDTNCTPRCRNEPQMHTRPRRARPGPTSPKWTYRLP